MEGEMFNSALCVVCQAEDAGTPLPQEMIDQYRSVRLRNGITLSVADATPKDYDDPMVDRTERVEGRMRYMMRVLIVQPITAAARAAVDEVKKEIKRPPSKQLADKKRRSRIFSAPIDKE